MLGRIHIHIQKSERLNLFAKLKTVTFNSQSLISNNLTALYF